MIYLPCKNPELPMSALGQKQTSADLCVMSALPPKADIQTGPVISFDATGGSFATFAAILRASSRVSG
jgi:hypothetical protein